MYIIVKLFSAAVIDCELR